MMPARRFRYLDLDLAQRTEVEDWCRAHRLDPKHIPVDASLGYDPATNEWVVDQYGLRDGRKFVRDGEVVKVKVRRLAVADPQMAWLAPS